MGSIWDVFRGLSGGLEPRGGSRGSGVVLVGLWGVWRGLGESRGRPGGVSGPSWGALGGARGRLGGVLGPSRGPLGGFLGASWTLVGAILVVLGVLERCLADKQKTF